jgi:hypothetical protein
MELRKVHDGSFPYVNLNGWRLVSEQAPPNMIPCLLGYLAERHPCAVLQYGIGYRDYNYCYWLGPRGIDPNYTRLENWQIILWRSINLPFTFDNERKGNTYVQARNILGDEFA